MTAKNNRSRVIGGIGLFVVAMAFGLVPSLLNVFVPGILLSAWIAGGGIALVLTTNRSPGPDPAWHANTTALALDAPLRLGNWEETGHASLTPEETPFDEDNWTWAHNGEIAH